MPDIRQGGCLCGAARYEIDVSDHETGNCHCSLCPKNTGSAFLTVTNVPADRFRWVSMPSGECHSSTNVIRRFCEHCGTPLTWDSSEFLDIANVGIGTLDNPRGLVISYEMYTRHRLKCISAVDGARQMVNGYETD